MYGLTTSHPTRRRSFPRRSLDTDKYEKRRGKIVQKEGKGEGKRERDRTGGKNGSEKDRTRGLFSRLTLGVRRHCLGSDPPCFQNWGKWVSE